MSILKFIFYLTLAANGRFHLLAKVIKNKARCGRPNVRKPRDVYREPGVNTVGSCVAL